MSVTIPVLVDGLFDVEFSYSQDSVPLAFDDEFKDCQDFFTTSFVTQTTQMLFLVCVCVKKCGHVCCYWSVVHKYCSIIL